ncbi:MAG TPA: TonB-dependent hemoglobin/transferrin/lactoferrin family receptor [Prochlorococcaceae cyanobacterium Fu_MAG_50]|nr:TonB-dependent hemoglobin/transferrin/lactoferrin family receptor [Prochlorococcaceae cyanobacterium Fu_MAG_50]
MRIFGTHLMALIALTQYSALPANGGELYRGDLNESRGQATELESSAKQNLLAEQGPAIGDLSNNHQAVQELQAQNLETAEDAKEETAEEGKEGVSDDHADTQPEAINSFPDDFLRITVTGTRTPRKRFEVPATISIFTLQDIEDNSILNLRDLFQYEPGISVRNNVRYGLQDVNIRGIEGNRILYRQDGVRLPERFQFGPLRVSRGEWVDFLTVSRVEVLRGPASSLYGSDALGGVINFTSLRPDDLLEGDESLAFDIPLIFSSANYGFAEAFRMAGRFDERLSVVMAVTREDGKQTNVLADDSMIDPQLRSGQGVYGNLVHSFNDYSELSLIVERSKKKVETKFAPDNLAKGDYGFSTSSFEEDITFETWRSVLTFEYDNPDDPGWLQYALARLYYDSSSQKDHNEEFRKSNYFPMFRDTHNEFINQISGGELQLRNDFGTGDATHQLTYGIDLSSTFNSRTRDRLVTNLIFAQSSNRSAASTFPTKDFPDSRTRRLGLYLQDEVTYLNWELIAGIRYDDYNLTTLPDEIYEKNGSASADIQSNSLSPKLSLLYNFTDEFAAYGSYARGFRAPLYSEINNGFTNIVGSIKYKTLSNPDLQPETSNSYEIGLRARFPQLKIGLTGFYNDYDNFILPFSFAGIGCLEDVDICPANSLVSLYQSQNLRTAEIYGFELGSEIRLQENGEGFSLLASLGLTYGNDLGEGEPLESVDPFKTVVGLRYRAPDKKWEVELIGTYVGVARIEKNEFQQIYLPDAYTQLDLKGLYNINENLSLNAGIYNLLNTRYFIYSDTRYLNAEDPNINRYSQPGTYIRGGVVFKF